MRPHSKIPALAALVAALAIPSLLVGCAPDTEPHPPEEMHADDHAPPPPGADEDRGAPPELGELVRGHLARAAEEGGIVFEPCGDGAPEHWVVDQTGGALVAQLRNLAADGRGRVYAEVRAEEQPAIPEGPGRSYGQSLALFEVRHLAPESRGCDDALDGFAFQARGNEPFWSLEVGRDGATLSRPDADDVTWNAPGVPEPSAAGAFTYSLSQGARTVQLILEPEPCTDSMSGAYFFFTARVAIDGETLRGCAREGAEAPTAVGRSLERQKQRAAELAKAKTEG
jgi:putative lipoprotein